MQPPSHHSLPGRRPWSLALSLGFVLALLAPAGVNSQEGTAVDWRGALTCPAADQVFAGLLYCTGADRSGATVHVVAADLAAKNLHFEYVLPEGATDRNPEQVSCGAGAKVAECRDANVPAWAGPEKGCFVPCDPDHYPRLTLPEAVERARAVRSEPGLAAVINGDYMASDATHGPEGLLVVRGERLDGAASCDDDYNAALRPWLGLGDKPDKATGLLPATVARLEQDGSDLPRWLYTGIGGGPWLVYKGQLDEQAAACEMGRQLDQIDRVRRCTGTKKKAPEPPLWEKYAPSACRAVPQTAAGLSQDGRWLFLAVSAGEETPDLLAQFLREKLGAWNVLKFDGGGSSQMWFAGASEVRVDPTGSGRGLSSYLAAYAPEGDGIALPIEAEPAEWIYYQVTVPGEEAELKIQMRNTGAFSWAPEDGIELRSSPDFGLGKARSLPLEARTAPGATATWHFRADQTTYLKFQVARRGKASGPELAAAVIVLPKGMEDKRQELEEKAEQAVEEWKAQDQAEVDELVERLRTEASEYLKSATERTLEGWTQQMQDWLNRTCPSPAGLGLAAVAAALAVRQRRKEENDHHHRL